MLILFEHHTNSLSFLSQRPYGVGGDLLAEAEWAGFDVLLTADNNIRYSSCGTEQWLVARLHIERAVNTATPGSYTEVKMSFKP
jgi:hypothetical protein